MIYLDNAATSKVEESVLTTFLEINREYYGNASSNHRFGFDSSKLLNTSRDQILKLLGLNDEYEVIFNSGATEGNNEAIKGVAFGYLNRGKHLITTKVEHPSVLETFAQLEKEFGFEVTYLDVNHDGSLDINELIDAIRKDTILVSIMAINNETGAINNINEIAKVIANYPKIFFHCDTTQAIGKIDLPLNKIDMFVISAHKIHGIKGSGALIKRKQIKLMPLLNGGGQENGYRSGTSNVAANVVLAKTLRLMLENHDYKLKHIQELNKHLKESLSTIDDVEINSPVNSSPYVINFSLKMHKASVVVEALSNHDIMVSTTSACSSKSHQSSHVLRAMGMDNRRASNSIRVSFAYYNTVEEIDQFVMTLENILNTIR